MDLEVEFGKRLSPSSMAAVGDFGSEEVLQCLMVGIDLDCMRCALEVVAPVEEALMDGAQFFVADGIVEFCWLKFFGIVCDRMLLAIVGLREDARKSNIGCIGVERDLFCWIEMA